MKVETRNAAGSATVSGGKIAISRIDIGAAIDTPATCTVQFHPPVDGRAIEVTAEDIVQFLANFQRLKFEAPTTAPVNVHADDGDGGRVVFLGFISEPVYSAGEGYVNLSANLQHVSSLLGGLRTDIYRSKSGWKLPNVEVPKGSIANRLWKVLELLIQGWEEAQGDGTLTPNDVAMANIVHEANATALAIWKRILSDSDAATKFETVDDVGSKDLDTSIADFIAQTYMASTGNFFMTLGAFAGAFHLNYIPSLSTDAFGRLIMTRYALNTSLEKSPIVKSVSPSLGSRALLPVTRVICTGAVGPNYKDELETAPVSIGPVISAWPADDVPSGNVATISPPPWLDSGALRFDPNPLASGFGVEAAKARKNRRLEVLKAANESVAKILSEWCRLHYVDMALGGDRVVLRCALDYSWVVGLRYSVSAKGGGVLFTGLLSGMQHSLSIDSAEGSGQGIAETVLSFTHVEMEGYQLPNK